MKIEYIKKVLQKHGLLTEFSDDMPQQISSISCNSKCCKPETLFFVKGVSFKPEYLDEAQKNGAVAYVGEKRLSSPLPFIGVSSVRKAMPVLADAFYENPYKKYKLAGITGTKGKTTVTYMLKNIFEEFFGKSRVGIISTMEAVCGDNIYQKSGTTPEALDLYSILNGFAENGASAACMEVSSQGLQYNRTDCIQFYVGAFLNLASDHISPTEHASFEEYKDAKKRLLKQCRYGVVNLDDKYAPEIIAAAECEKLYTVSAEQKADFYAENIIQTKSGISFCVSGSYIDGEVFELRMPGGFNVTNALVAIACAYICGCDTNSIRAGLLKTEIAGRMSVYEKNGITVLVDYAHNGMSVAAVLEHIRRFYPNAKITCLFGCPGNKAYDRRTEIPESVAKYADLAIVTSDDPENEEPQKIMDEVEVTLKKTAVPYVKIEDRETAIEYALKNARQGDVVFLAGKGPETTQKVQGKLVYYKGDMPYAKEILGGK